MAGSVPDAVGYICAVTLTWETQTQTLMPDGHTTRYRTQGWVATSFPRFGVDPRSDRERLTQDVISGARESLGAPHDAAVAFLSLEPKDLGITGTDPVEYLCTVTLAWYEVMRPDGYQGSQLMQATSSSRVSVDPRWDRERLTQDVISGARESLGAPHDAAVVFLSMEPNDLGLGRPYGSAPVA
ncbi:hypothetical protein ACFXPX_04970 [Kitasatospora sp. NPDC059146]|uniref:hypothetical protein n=1 Tax=unclassified Kitasatospora TaxID=2633591 RepID=UPI00367FE8C3